MLTLVNKQILQPSELPDFRKTVLKPLENGFLDEANLLDQSIGSLKAAVIRTKHFIESMRGINEQVLLRQQIMLGEKRDSLIKKLFFSAQNNCTYISDSNCVHLLQNTKKCKLQVEDEILFV